MVPSDSAEPAWSGLQEAVPLYAGNAEGSAEDGALAFKSIMGQYTINTSVVIFSSRCSCIK